MFHIIDRELEWRRKNNLPEGFEALKKCKPVLAVGADGPFLTEDTVIADYFRALVPFLSSHLDVICSNDHGHANGFCLLIRRR